MSGDKKKKEMFFVPLGTGDAFSDTWYSSCIYFEYDGFRMIVDCPHPVRKIMKEASSRTGLDISLENLDAIALTHLHADHCSGLECVGFYSYYVMNRIVTLLGHEDVIKDVWKDHLSGTMAPLCDPPEKQRRLTDFFNPVSMKEKETKGLGPFSIECKKTEHHVTTTAFRITAGNRSVGYSSDTSYSPELIDWLAEADLVIHETNVASHTPYEKLAALPVDIRKKMRLIHYPDDFDKDNSLIEPLEQGNIYRI